MKKPLSTLAECNDTEEYMKSKGCAKGDIETAKKYLKMVEEHGLRRPEMVVKVGTMLLGNKKARLRGEPLWTLCEQVALAALDLNDQELATQCIKKLHSEFPKSVRVGRLVGMQHESRGEWDKALEQYDVLLEKAPTEQRVMKRKVAVYKGQGKLSEAITELTKYLDTFMGDVEAWEELAGLYTSAQMYQQAVFSYEEVIVAQPQNYNHHRRIAEVYYTIGGEQNLVAAKRYFAAAVDMSTGRDVRSLYGIALCTAALKKFEKKGGSGSGGADDKGSHPELCAAACERLEQQYAAHNSALLPLVKQQLAPVKSSK